MSESANLTTTAVLVEQADRPGKFLKLHLDHATNRVTVRYTGFKEPVVSLDDLAAAVERLGAAA